MGRIAKEKLGKIGDKRKIGKKDGDERDEKREYSEKSERCDAKKDGFQREPRHMKVTAYGCSISRLTRFTGSHCRGPR